MCNADQNGYQASKGPHNQGPTQGPNKGTHNERKIVDRLQWLHRNISWAKFRLRAAYWKTTMPWTI